MTLNEAKSALESFERTMFAYNHAMGLIYYDGATIAPKKSAEVRNITLGELSRMQYELSTAPSTMEMIETLMQNKDSLDEITYRKASEMWREFEQIKRIPVDEYVAWTELTNTADAVWHEAKEKDDFNLFEPYLQKLFDSAKKIALYREPDKDPYDTMLDTYERGLTKETCDQFFSALRNNLVPLIDKVIKNKDKVDDKPLQQIFPAEKQREFSSYLMDVMGIDKDRCIIGETEHPFTTDFSKNDVRITTHYHEDMLVSSMYSVIHEGGHALYELHTGDNLIYSSLGTGVSMAIHESQSRFYENIIGRSFAFSKLIFPWLKENFPVQFKNIDVETFWKIINKSEPSLIRTEADELTYAMHIMIRYELEKKMFNGEIKAKDLPNEWNKLYKEYLGIDVPNNRCGVLQDSHWSNGNIGYFPSYAIGSAYGAQFLNEMEKEFNVFEAVSNGEIAKINNWLEEKIWRFGSLMDPGKLFESVCGKFDPTYFVKYLENKYKEIYDI